MPEYATRSEAVRALYDAFAAGNRAVAEELLAAEYRFSAPPDPDLDRDGFFEVCWPNSGSIGAFDIVRLIEDGDEVVVTYEATREDGSRFRNTEVLGFDGDEVVRAEVYFGWELE
jgi:ketosteroid isomerase-like protein